MNSTAHRKFSDLIPYQKDMGLHVYDVLPGHGQFNKQEITRHDFFSILFLSQGEITMKLNLKEYNIKQNSLIFLAPNMISDVVSVSKNSQIQNVEFNAKFLIATGVQKQEMGVFDFDRRTNENIIELNDSELNTIKKNFEDLRSSDARVYEHPFGESIVQHTFHIFLSELAALYISRKKNNPNKNLRTKSLVAEFINLVDSHFKQNRSVKYYADQLCITPKYLTEVVRDITGESAGTLIDEKVIYETKLLLHDSRFSIAQIAEMLHFSDQSFLGKFFKRHTGLSPTEYRNHN